jgi:hypothetical protein
MFYTLLYYCTLFCIDVFCIWEKKKYIHNANICLQINATETDDDWDCDSIHKLDLTPS